MAAGARHSDAKSATAQSLMRDALKTTNVERNELAVAACPRRSLKDMAYTPEISLTFFSDTPHADNRFLKSYSGFARSAQSP